MRIMAKTTSVLAPFLNAEEEDVAEAEEVDCEGDQVYLDNLHSFIIENLWYNVTVG